MQIVVCLTLFGCMCNLSSKNFARAFAISSIVQVHAQVSTPLPITQAPTAILLQYFSSMLQLHQHTTAFGCIAGMTAKHYNQQSFVYAVPHVAVRPLS